jgi:hypothetical protein
MKLKNNNKRDVTIAGITLKSGDSREFPDSISRNPAVKSLLLRGKLLEVRTETDFDNKEEPQAHNTPPSDTASDTPDTPATPLVPPVDIPDTANDTDFTQTDAPDAVDDSENVKNDALQVLESMRYLKIDKVRGLCQEYGVEREESDDLKTLKAKLTEKLNEVISNG